MRHLPTARGPVRRTQFARKTGLRFWVMFGWETPIRVRER